MSRKRPSLCINAQLTEFVFHADNNNSNSRDKSSANNLSPSISSSSETIDDFIIPELPSGTNLKLDISSTWGDKHYVGLNGIELFNSNGDHIKVKEVPQESARILRGTSINNALSIEIAYYRLKC